MQFIVVDVDEESRYATWLCLGMYVCVLHLLVKIAEADRHDMGVGHRGGGKCQYPNSPVAPV